MLESRLGRSPSESELAAALGYTQEQLQQVLAQVSLMATAALDEMVADHSEASTLADTIADDAEGPGALFERRELRGQLAAAIEAMPEREKVVLTL